MRTVVITGVSRGLGAAFFDRLHRRGDRILAIGRTFSPDQERLATTAPDRIRLVAADLGALAMPGTRELATFLHDATEAVLLHNAGEVEPIAAAGELVPAQVVHSMNVNLTAPILLTNAFLAALPARVDRVRVVYISSGAVRRVLLHWGVYGTAKTGAERFFETVAAERAGDSRFTVVNVNPGTMDTRMQEVIRATDFPERDDFAQRHARGEMADPEVIADKIIESHLTSE